MADMWVPSSLQPGVRPWPARARRPRGSSTPPRRGGRWPWRATRRAAPRAVRARPLGHEVVQGGRDDAVLLAVHEPGRQALPQRTVARWLCQRLLRGRPLGRSHQGGLLGVDVLHEDLVEPLGQDRQIGQPVVPLDDLQGVLAEHAAGEHRREPEAVLACVRREAVDVDQRDDVAGVRVDVGDHGAAVRVGDQHHGPVDRADDVADRAASDARLRSGLAAATTGCPARCSSGMTRSQLADSANAPWTSTMVERMTGSLSSDVAPDGRRVSRSTMPPGGPGRLRGGP